MSDERSPVAPPRADRWRWAKAAWLSAYGVAKSALTAPDGESWAPGRIMGFGVFVVGQCLVVRASAQMLGRPMDPNNWSVFFTGVATFEAAVCATAIGLVLGMAPSDPGGKWWGRDASPSPPADKP